MPHLVIPYTANLEPHTDMTALCRTMADSQRDYAFADLHVRMAPGRSEAVKQRVGDGLLAAAKAHFAHLFEQRLLGMTLQIDDAPSVYDGKQNNINPLFPR